MLNLGIIGAGAVVQGGHAPALKARKDLRVVAVADPAAENRARVAELVGAGETMADYPELLARDDVDAVDICLPHDMHEAAVLAAFDAGKDVILEKPIALNLEQADRMTAAARDKGRRFHVILNQRFIPAHAKVKQLLDSGARGRPFLALAHLIGDEYARMNIPGHWKGSRERAGGGALMDTGTHIVDLMNWWFGKPKSVTCRWGRLRVEPDNKGDDNVAVMLDYDGMLADVVVSYTAVSDAWREDKRIYFPESSLHVYPDDEKPLLEGRGKAPLVPIDVEPMQSWWQESETRALDHFLDCLTGRAQPWYGPEAARDALEVILAAYQSADEGRTVPL